MSGRKKTWGEKLADDKGLPKVVPLTGKMAAKWGPGAMVVPAPREVADLMRRVPPGRLLTLNHLREVLARKHGADLACPLTCGIFAWIAAHAAAEAALSGETDLIPYWRILKAGGKLNPKYPGGLPEQRQRLMAEGHRIIRKGTHYVVDRYEAALAQF